jgi:Flp pilus assembly protein TadD
LDRAISNFAKAIHLDPKDAEAYKDRGQAYGKKGNEAKAGADFDQAKKLGGKNR